MQILPNSQPPPRLLTSAVLAHERPDATPAQRSSSALRKGGLFRGNGLAIFVGLGLSAVLLAGGAKFMSWREAVTRGDGAAPRLLGVATKHISTSPEAVVPPQPLVVQILPEHIRVTAISLGLPRLAVINGRQIGEGEYLLVHTPTAHVQVRLRVHKIADGHIELTDGAQTIRARIGLPPKKP